MFIYRAPYSTNSKAQSLYIQKIAWTYTISGNQITFSLGLFHTYTHLHIDTENNERVKR